MQYRLHRSGLYSAGEDLREHTAGLYELMIG